MTKIVARPSIILSTTAGSVVTGPILVTQGSSVIRVCAFGIALSTFAIFSIIACGESKPKSDEKTDEKSENTEQTTEEPTTSKSKIYEVEFSTFGLASGI